MHSAARCLNSTELYARCITYLWQHRLLTPFVYASIAIVVLGALQLSPRSCRSLFVDNDLMTLILRALAIAKENHLDSEIIPGSISHVSRCINAEMLFL